MLSDIILAGLASLYVWVLFSQLHPPLIGRALEWIRRGFLRPLLACAWCTGFWLSVIFVIALQWERLDWIITPLTILASAGVTGFLGSFTPGMEMDDGEDD